jgi:glucose/arabinose dehydrogenase
MFARCFLVSGAALAAAMPSLAQLPTHVSARNAPVEQGARRETLVEGLEHPWAMAWLPDGTMLVSERPGRLRIVQNGTLRSEPVAGVPAVLNQGQGGLLDLAVHPRFATNRLVYMTLAQGTAEANATVVARGRLSEDLSRLTDVQPIYTVPRAKSGGQHFGSRLLFLPDGSLLVSIGDGGNPPASLDGAHIRKQAQNVGAAFGKVLRLTDEGKPAPGNPLARRTGALPEIYTLGHRNIQGLAWDAGRRAVWVNEHGALGGDEINRLSPGANYGWPNVSRTREYVGAAPVGTSSAPGMTDPVLLWEVSTAPSGLVVYDGTAFPQWRGDLFSGGLASSDIRRIDMDAAGRVQGETSLRMGARVRDVRVGPDGLLYALTDERQGRLIRFVPAPVTPPVIAPR